VPLIWRAFLSFFFRHTKRNKGSSDRDTWELGWGPRSHRQESRARKDRPGARISLRYGEERRSLPFLLPFPAALILRTVSSDTASCFGAQLVKSGSMDDMVLAGQKHRIEVANANAPIMTAVTKIVTSVEGKDKVFRMLFFGFKLLRAATQRQMMPVQLLETALLDARRVFRLFREVEPLQALLRHMSNGKPKHPWIKACKLTQLAAFVGFFISNHLVLLTKVKLLKLSPGRLRGLYGICFLLGQSAGLFQDIYRMYLLRHAMSALPAAGEDLPGEEHSAASARRFSPQTGTHVARRAGKGGNRAQLVAADTMSTNDGSPSFDDGQRGFTGSSARDVAAERGAEQAGASRQDTSMHDPRRHGPSHFHIILLLLRSDVC